MIPKHVIEHNCPRRDLAIVPLKFNRYGTSERCSLCGFVAQPEGFKIDQRTGKTVRFYPTEQETTII